MKEFNRLCREFEQLDAESYSAVLIAKSAQILPALAAVTGDGLGGIGAFAVFVLGAVAADGKLSEEEFLFCRPFFELFFGEGADYESCRKTALSMHRESKELKKEVDEMVDILGQLSEDLKDDIIIVCMLICAIDGKISLEEKRWIKQLIK